VNVSVCHVNNLFSARFVILCQTVCHGSLGTYMALSVMYGTVHYLLSAHFIINFQIASL